MPLRWKHALRTSLKSPKRLVPLIVVSSFFLLFLWHWDDAITVHWRDFGYVTRPLWDKAPRRFSRVITLQDAFTAQAAGSHAQSKIDLCTAHSLQPSASATAPKVYDVFLFSVELDLLEIRLHELFDAVDTFVIFEANVTFSGRPKPLTFYDNRHRFDFARRKIVYRALTNLVSNTTEDPMKNELRMRRAVADQLNLLKPANGSVILESDVDEIPSARAVELLKSCTGWEDTIHLGMPTFLYSYEFPMARPDENAQGKVNAGEGAGTRQWRASAKHYRKGKTTYTHSRQSDMILENAGWHCSFCFRYIEDFVFKMTSYSHNDRVTHHSQLVPSAIQDKICHGRDIYDMLPEAFDYPSLVRQWGAIPAKTDTEGLPQYLIKHKEAYRFLLPGGCTREQWVPKTVGKGQPSV